MNELVTYASRFPFSPILQACVRAKLSYDSYLTHLAKSISKEPLRIKEEYDQLLLKQLIEG
jgi:hypothetical protein